RWSYVFRWQAKRAGMQVNDHVFGLGWSGHMISARVRGLIAHLPPGLSEIYFHPATRQDAVLRRLMPDYDPVGELSALCDPALPALLAGSGVTQTGWGWSEL